MGSNIPGSKNQKQASFCREKPFQKKGDHGFKPGRSWVQTRWKLGPNNCWSPADGVQEMGLEQIHGYLREKAFVLFFVLFVSGFSPSRQGVKQTEEGCKRLISRKRSQTPLHAPSVSPHLRQPQIESPQKR